MMALSGYESPMLPKHLFEGTDIKASKYANAPVGTGPFKFVEWQRGQFIRLDRNPDYWKQGRPYLDRIVARFVADSATRTAAMEKGEAHVGGFAAIPWPDVKTLAKLPTIETTTKGYEMSSPIVQLDFNTRKPPFDNLKVRQAVSYAISRKAVIENVWFGWGKPATGPISSNFAPVGFYTPEVRRYDVPNGVETANKLLDEAGFKRGAGGIRFEIVHDLTPYGEEWQRYGEYVQQVLAELGIKATLRYEDVATWLSGSTPTTTSSSARTGSRGWPTRSSASIVSTTRSRSARARCSSTRPAGPRRGPISSWTRPPSSSIPRSAPRSTTSSRSSSSRPRRWCGSTSCSS